MTLTAVLLAGGRATRLGGAAKPLLEVGGRSLLGRAVDAAAAAGASDIVVAGPVLDDALPVRWVREDPPFTGPAAALVAAVAALPRTPAAGDDWTLVLACDLVRPDRAVRRLVTDLELVPADTDGICLGDEGSRPQWLTGAYRTGPLRRAAASLPDAGRGRPVRELLEDLAVAVVRADHDVVADVDTWEDLERAREKEREHMSTHLPPEALDEWAAALRERLGLGEDDLPISLILDLAADVARGVARPAAPFSAFAAGLAAGRAGGTPEQVREAVESVSALAAGWES